MDSNRYRGIDLHIHSTASDGTCTPEEILSLARELDLAAISITDHDTVEGSRQAMEAGIPETVQFVSGVEISTASPPEYPCHGSLHILGYGFQVDDRELTRTLEILQTARKNRNPEIINKLKALGFDISMAELTENYGESQLGRPHVARLMVKKGFAESINDAFDRYLGNGQPAYTQKYRVDCRRAIEVIIQAGGVPVLAHPILIQPLTDKPVAELIKSLKSMGLMGLEAYYAQHEPADIERFIEIARQYGLLVTGGTDFHGELIPDIRMGTGKGGLKIPPALFDDLMNAVNKIQAIAK